MVRNLQEGVEVFLENNSCAHLYNWGFGLYCDIIGDLVYCDRVCTLLVAAAADELISPKSNDYNDLL